MYLSHLVPISYLGKVDLGRFHLALAHLFLESVAYTAFYQERSKKGEFVILDNSYFEGKLVDDKSLVRVGLSIGAKVIVVPDSLRVKEAKEKTEKFLVSAYDEVGGSPPFDLMGVCHGETLSEMVEFLSYFSENPEVGWIGFPARCGFYKELKWGRASEFFSKNLGFKRVGLLDFLEERDLIENMKRYHLLGCMDPIELAYSKVFPFVSGCDSSVAYVESKGGRVFGDYGIEGERSKEQIDFYDEYDVKVARLFERNVEKMNRWAGYLEF